MTPDPAAVSFQDVTFAYDTTPIIRHASFNIAPDEPVSIVGPNGGGKTTLLRLILGSVHPSRGTVRVFGKSPSHMCRRIGYMPQRVDLDPMFPVTVMDVVLMGRLGSRLAGPYSKQDRKASRRALEEMRIEEYARAPLSDLSGGQRQRVLIARALACDPDILLLDEPTSSVDAKVEARLHDTLLELRERMTIVLVSHDLGFVSSLVDRVICVNREVKVHCTSDITDEVIEQMYGAHQHAIRHDHDHTRDGKDDGWKP